MSVWVSRAIATALLALLVTSAGLAAGKRYGLGRAATPEEIAGWDIDVRPDGLGLPPGQGTVEDGEAIYVEACAACHGEFGEAIGRYPALMGGEGSLSGEDPVKTVGSYWPYASTVFDYVRRAMPFGHAQSLSDDETYAITAFLLNINGIVEEGFVLSAKTLAGVQMPNHDGFVPDDRPDVSVGEPCMKDCRDEATIVGRARQLDVTPQGAGDGAGDTSAAAGTGGEIETGGDVARGKAVFATCSACHSLADGEHGVGPSLRGVFGRQAGAASGFSRYSPAMRAAGIEWNRETLRAFLAAPQTVVAGNAMPFAGITDAGRLEDLLSYLRTATGTR